jgi:hypothetical protein
MAAGLRPDARRKIRVEICVPGAWNMAGQPLIPTLKWPQQVEATIENA